jgi:hypothetical protein
VPLGYLTDAILETIFELCVVWAYFGATKHAKELLKLTHVCWWWREVALACPRLWCNIEICHPRLAEEFLNRRGTTGPIVFVSSPGDRLPKLGDFERLLHTADRVCQLDVVLPPADMRLLLYRLGAHFEHILAMRLIVEAPAGAPVNDEVHIKSKDLPCLRQLLLDGVTMNWSFISNLTVLSLCGLSGTKALLMSELQVMFRNNPRLEWLALDEVALSPSDTTNHVGELPRLHTLRLSMPPRCTRRIMAGLRIPPSAQTIIRIWGDNDYIMSVFPESDGKQHAFVKFKEDWTLSIRSRRIIVQHSKSRPFSNNKAALEMEVPQHICVTTFPTIAQTFDLLLLTTLELDFMHPDFIPREAIKESLAVTRKFLRPLLNLKTLRVCQALADILAPVLGECISLFPDMMCPSLACLSFGDPHQMWWNFPTAVNGDTTEGWLKPVATSLQARRTVTQTKLKTLEFIGVGHINRDATSHLLPFVENIVNSVSCPVDTLCAICAQGPSWRAGW